MNEDVRNTISDLASTSQGLCFLGWLLGLGRAIPGEFNPHVPGDPAATAFNCGELQVGQQILMELISVNPQIPILVFQEIAKNGRGTDAARGLDSGDPLDPYT